MPQDDEVMSDMAGMGRHLFDGELAPGALKGVVDSPLLTRRIVDMRQTFRRHAE